MKVSNDLLDFTIVTSMQWFTRNYEYFSWLRLPPDNGHRLFQCVLLCTRIPSGNIREISDGIMSERRATIDIDSIGPSRNKETPGETCS